MPIVATPFLSNSGLKDLQTVAVMLTYLSCSVEPYLLHLTLLYFRFVIKAVSISNCSLKSLNGYFISLNFLIIHKICTGNIHDTKWPS